MTSENIPGHRSMSRWEGEELDSSLLRSGAWLQSRTPSPCFPALPSLMHTHPGVYEALFTSCSLFPDGTEESAFAQWLPHLLGVLIPLKRHPPVNLALRQTSKARAIMWSSLEVLKHQGASESIEGLVKISPSPSPESLK